MNGSIMYRMIKQTIVSLLPGIVGAITVNCGATSPASPTSVTCFCKNWGGKGVEWWEDTTFVSTCLFSHNCSHYWRGYTFSINQTEQMFTMTVSPYNYSDCQQFTCKDFSNTSIQQSQKLSIIDFDSTMPSVIAEPVSNNTSGDISITTSCISGYSDLIAEWYTVVNGTKKTYKPVKDIEIIQIDNTTCIACNNESAATIKLGFHHKEAVDNKALEGYIQLELYHPDYPSDKLVRKTTNVYKVAVSGYSDGSNRNGFGWVWIFLLLCIGALIIIIVVIVRPKQVKEFRVTEVTDSEIAVMWDKNTKCCGRAKYILGRPGKEKKVLPYTIVEYKFTNLSPRKTYSLKIQGKNSILRGQKSTIWVRTKGKPAKPIDFGAVENGIAESSITVQWKPGDDGGHQQTFTLTCANRKYEQPYQAETKLLKHTFTNLSEGTDYDFSVFARNEFGSSEVVTLKLRTNGKPAKPIDFGAVENGIAESSITVQWKPGDDGGHHKTFTLTCKNQKYEKPQCPGMFAM